MIKTYSIRIEINFKLKNKKSLYLLSTKKMYSFVLCDLRTDVVSLLDFRVMLRTAISVPATVLHLSAWRSFIYHKPQFSLLSFTPLESSRTYQGHDRPTKGNLRNTKGRVAMCRICPKSVMSTLKNNSLCYSVIYSTWLKSRGYYGIVKASKEKYNRDRSSMVNCTMLHGVNWVL